MVAASMNAVLAVAPQAPGPAAMTASDRASTAPVLGCSQRSVNDHRSKPAAHPLPAWDAPASQLRRHARRDTSRDVRGPPHQEPVAVEAGKGSNGWWWRSMHGGRCNCAGRTPAGVVVLVEGRQALERRLLLHLGPDGVADGHRHLRGHEQAGRHAHRDDGQDLGQLSACVCT